MRPGLGNLKKARQERWDAYRLAVKAYLTGLKLGWGNGHKPVPASYDLSEWEAGNIWKQAEAGLACATGND